MILKLFLFWRVGLFLVTYLGAKTFPLIANGGIGAIGPGKQFDFWASWAQWDGGHFYNISKFGYFGPNEYAFFPLFPLLVKILSFPLLGNNLLAGLLIANILYLAFLYIFFRLIDLKFGKKVAVASLFTVITFPTSFFSVAFYSESLFLLLAASTLLLLEKNKPFLASITIILATLTRFVGIFLVLPLIFFYLKSIDFKLNKINFRFLSIPISLLGILGYGLYLYLKFNDPFYFFTVQSTWHRLIVNPLSTIYSYLTQNIFSKPFNDYLDVISTISFVLILIAGLKKIPFSWVLFGLLVVLVPASSTTLTSMPRYVLASLPTFILAGMFLKDRRLLSILLWTIFLSLQIFLAIKFVNGYWVA